MAFPTGYSKYQEITIDHTKVDADLTDFPVYVNLANLVKAGADIFDTCRSDGGDIRATLSDGTTQLATELVAIDTTAKTGELHVKVPAVANSSATVIRIWYNGTDTALSASDTYGSQNVWTNSYLAVYHMNQNPAGSAPQILDSTANAAHGTTANMESGDSVDAKIGKGLRFDGNTGANEQVAFGDVNDYTANFTAQFWAKCNDINERVLHKAGNWSMLTRGDSFMYFEPVNSAAGGLYEVNNGADIVDSTLRMYHGVINGTTSALIYVNGALAGTDSSVNGSASAGNTNDFRMASNGSGDWFDGDLDEVRISSTNRTATWISTEYNNQNSPSTFYAVGDEQVSSITYNQDVFATSSVAASMLTPKTMLAALTASVAGSASIATIKDYVRELAATATATASVLKGLAQEISASTAITASTLAQRAYLVALSASVAVSATTQTAIQKLLEATSNVSASITKTFNVSQLVSATASIAATLEAGREKVLEATAAITASITTAVGKTLTADVSIIARLLAPFYKTKYPAHGDGDEYEVKYPHDTI